MSDFVLSYIAPSHKPYDYFMSKGHFGSIKIEKYSIHVRQDTDVQ